MDIDKLVIRKNPVDEKFDYRMLYSDSRGAIFKKEMKSLIKESVIKKEVTIEQCVIAENVRDELFEIVDKKGHEQSLIKLLKNHHGEGDNHFAPMMILRT